MNDQQLATYDQQRQDQQYYAYLANLRAAANPSASGAVVGSSAAAGSGTAAAYGNQGGNLAQIYSNLGGNLAGNYAQAGANLNNAVQSGIGNFLTYDYLRNRDQPEDSQYGPYAGGYRLPPPSQ